MPQAEVDRIEAADTRCTSSELEQRSISYVRLELVPRGIGRIQVRATNFYQELKPGEQVQMSLTVANDGTRRLYNIKVGADAPVGWVVSVIPDVIPMLLPGKEITVAVTIAPPSDVGVGDYEATIKTESLASNRRVESEDKKIRIHIAARTNLLGTGALVIVLIGVLIGVVVFGVRLSRR